MKLYKCNKTVLRFYPKGPTFINGYTTNTVDADQNVFADLQGRIVAVVHQHKVSDDEMHIVVETPFVDRLTGHLRQYLALSDTTVVAMDNIKVFWDLESHRLVISDQALPATVTEEEFTIYRVQNGIPLQGVDFDQEMVLNVAGEGLVSYTKGCYLGQEIVARVHYRGRPPKRLALKYEEDCDWEQRAQMTSAVIDPGNGQRMGFVFDKTEGDV